MRIAHLAPQSLPAVGGAEVLLHNLALEQAGRDHEVTVVTRWPIARSALSHLPYRVVPLVPSTFHWAATDASPDGHWLIRRQLAALQRIRRFDLWHVHTAHPAGTAAIGPLRRLGVPTVLTAHGSDLMVDPAIGYGLRLDPGIDARVRAAVPRFAAVTAISPPIHHAVSALGVAPDRIFDVPNGVDVDRIAQHTVDRSALREAIGIAPDAPLILTVARNDPGVKGLDLVPGIVATVAESHPGARWLFVGRGTASLESTATADRIRCDEGRPPRPSAATWPGDWLLDRYHAADVFVLPSRVEAMPLVLLEAMAAGDAAVVADTPGCRRLVQHGRNGLVCRPGDPSAFAAAVSRLLSDPDERAALGRAAAATARTFSLPAVADAYDEVYAAVGATGASP
jgi:glycosyltransferase involved in cell wall biosynthesis